jgi:hypothetical protein
MFKYMFSIFCELYEFPVHIQYRYNTAISSKYKFKDFVLYIFLLKWRAESKVLQSFCFYTYHVKCLRHHTFTFCDIYVATVLDHKVVA